MQLRCYLTHPSLKGRHICGYVENLSRVGVLFRCENGMATPPLPMIGDDFELDIELPMHRPLARKRSLHCLATVARIPVGPNGDRYLAAEISDMQFRDLPLEFSNTFFADAKTESGVV